MAVADVVPANPCIGIKTGQAVRRDPRFLTIPQLRQLIVAVKEAGDQALVCLLGTAGLRISKAHRLNVEDVIRTHSACHL